MRKKRNKGRATIRLGQPARKRRKKNEKEEEETVWGTELDLMSQEIVGEKETSQKRKLVLDENPTPRKKMRKREDIRRYFINKQVHIDEAEESVILGANDPIMERQKCKDVPPLNMDPKIPPITKQKRKLPSWMT